MLRTHRGRGLAGQLQWVVEGHAACVRDATVDRTSRFRSGAEGRERRCTSEPFQHAHLLGLLASLALAVRMLSTRSFESLFEHLNTITDEDSLLLPADVPAVRRSLMRYMNISLSGSGPSA